MAARPRSSTPKKAPRRDWKPAFLEAMRELGNVRAATEAVGIDRTTPYKAREDDPAFALDWSDAVEDAADRLEKEAFRRAHDGWDKPVYQGGEHVGTIREYSDTLLIFLLKGCRPEKYRERVQTDVTVTGSLEQRIAELDALDASG